jgi:hypothetical protein
VNNFETILTFNEPAQLDIIRVKLEDAGIVCHVPDEHTAAWYPHYINAIGGLRLQVRQRDMELATAILIRHGYIRKKYKWTTESEGFQIGATWPLIGKLRPEIRLVIVFSIIAIAVVGIAYWVISDS